LSFSWFFRVSLSFKDICFCSPSTYFCPRSLCSELKAFYLEFGAFLTMKFNPTYGGDLGVGAYASVTPISLLRFYWGVEIDIDLFYAAKGLRI